VIEVRLEDIQSALSQWARREVELQDRVRLLEGQIAEVTLLHQHGIEQVQDGFGLTKHPHATLALAVEEALLSVANAGTEQVRTITAQKDRIERVESKLVGLEVGAQEAVDRIVAALELPPNRHRNLYTATTEAIDMVNEAKKMVRENL
jgi:hypothetical protein